MTFIDNRLFCQKYGLNIDAVDVAKSQGRIPDVAFYKEPKHRYKLDEDYFKKRWAFIRKIQLENQELYHYLADDYSVREIAAEVLKSSNDNTIQSMCNYLRVYLWMIPEPSLKLTVSGSAWNAHKLYRAINIKLGKINLSIEKLLDKRMKG